ncbi:hypothetical protein HDV01_003658 [Terramyces sp. JEL0728]|nr:hypothetical protein HDV01_003658 [Terramyces sp. JEL0728]
MVANGILFLNTEILLVFSVLNENITRKKIKVFRIVIFVSVFILQLPNNLRVFCGPTIPPAINQFMASSALLMVLVIVIYDNCQALYLTLLVFWNKKAKSKGKLTKDTLNAFKRVLFTNIFILLFDWGAVLIFGYLMATYDADLTLRDFALGQISELNTSIHSCIMIFVIKELKNFTFSDARPKQKVKIGESTKIIRLTPSNKF